MRTIAALCIAALTLSGCATVQKTVTGPGGYKYTESITAIGGSSIEKATQTFGGTLEVFGEDGKPRVKATLDSAQEGEGIAGDPEALGKALLFLGELMTGATTP